MRTTVSIDPDLARLLEQRMADDMNMQANLLAEYTLPSQAKVSTDANTGGDPMTSLHMRNWMECVRSRKTPNASVHAGYNHSVSNIMTRTALQTGKRVTFDDKKQEVIVS